MMEAFLYYIPKDEDEVIPQGKTKLEITFDLTNEDDQKAKLEVLKFIKQYFDDVL